MNLPAPAFEPGATIGILGSGQLARMLALAAARLGFKCHIFAPDRDSPAFDVVRECTRADYEDEQALARFAEHVDVVTYEFENVPAETATLLASLVPVLPDPKVLAITQDRIAEKDFITSLGIGTATYAAVGTATELLTALDHVGRPAVLKTRRFGYDGKGQALIREGSDLAALYRALGGDGVAELVARDRLEQGRRHHPYRMDSDGAVQDGSQRGRRPQRVVLDQP